jgi:alpha-tubulin suppressor-like RCC1 family protein
VVQEIAMKNISWTLAPTLAGALLVIALGCRENAESPTGPEATAPGAPALATATAPLAFRQVSAGTSHTCGLTTDDRAYCWGGNATGQLGDRTHTRRLRPVAVAGGLRFVQISAGNAQSCGVTAENRAYCWGNNDFGQLGDGTTTSRSTPVRVVGRLFRQIRTGFLHTCGVNPNDVAFCWGANTFGQLGTGGSRTSTPTRVAAPLVWAQVIAAGSHTCGVTTSKVAYCWGNNDFGQLGDGTRTRRSKPVAVTGGLSFKQVVPGAGWYLENVNDPAPDDGHTCGITTGDKAYCWGLNGGWLGEHTTGLARLTPLAVHGGRSWRFVNLGNFHTCGVTLSRAGYCWGNNDFGQLGTGGGNTTTPALVAGGLEFNSISAATVGHHNCGWTTDNRAYCWGHNDAGQLGDGTTTNRSTPVAVVGPM